MVKYERKMDCILLFKLDPSHEHNDRSQSSASGASQGSTGEAIAQVRTGTPQPQVSPLSVSTNLTLQQQTQSGHSQDDVVDDSLEYVSFFFNSIQPFESISNMISYAYVV